MTTDSYKLIATIPTLNLTHTFPLEVGRCYLLGSGAMESGMLIFSHDRSLSRRQAWLEVKEGALHVERHPQASQKLNGSEAITKLQLRHGESFTAGATIFQFIDVSEENAQRAPDLTYTLSAASPAAKIGKPEFQNFMHVVGQMPGLMQAHRVPGEFLIALSQTLQKYIPDLQVAAFAVELQEDLPKVVPLTTRSESQAADATAIKPSRNLVKQAMALAGDECAVSVWSSRSQTGELFQSVLASGAQWAMCIAISLSESERFALYATGAQTLLDEQQNEVKQLFAALGAIAKQHLLAARAQERQGQIGQFFSPALRAILFGDIAEADCALQPAEHEATICFFDLRGSSRLVEDAELSTASQRRPAAGHFAFLEKVIGSATSVVFETGGIVIDFQGDAILACWGIPPRGALQAPARQAIVAARRIVELMIEYDWPPTVCERRFSMRCGLGIACGKVLAGLFNAHGRNQTRLSKYTVIGRAVNQAARLEGMTKQFGVPLLIDGAMAMALANENMLLRRIARVQPAGMSEVVEVYEPVLPKELGGTDIDENGVQAYETALAFFEKGNFESAAAALRVAPTDQIQALLHERIMKHCGENCPPNWTGVISLSSK